MLNEERGRTRSDPLNGRHGGDPIAPAGVDVLNPAFDVTPARLITGIITERGVFTPGAGVEISLLIRAERGISHSFDKPTIHAQGFVACHVGCFILPTCLGLLF